jgi:hypothetical protein
MVTHSDSTPAQLAHSHRHSLATSQEKDLAEEAEEMLQRSAADIAKITCS